jgi:hypothetical protein
MVKCGGPGLSPSQRATLGDMSTDDAGTAQALASDLCAWIDRKRISPGLSG